MADGDDWTAVGGSKGQKKKGPNQPQQKKNEPKPSQQQPQKQQPKPQQRQPQQQTRTQVSSGSVQKVTEQMSQVKLEPKPSGPQKGGTKKPEPKKGPTGKGALTKFVPRPERTGKAPGKDVRLISNLIKIIIKGGEAIYQSGVNVDLIKDEDSKGGKATVSKKLGNDIRRAALSEALDDYLRNNKPEWLKKPYRYLTDANASMVLTLFDISDGDASKKSYEFFVKVPRTSRDGSETEDEFKVTIFKPESISLDDRATGPEHMRTLNVILTYKFWSIDRFFLSRAAAGHTSIFPYERENQFGISPGIFCNKGCSVSARPAECGLVLNVAITNAPFYESCSLLEFIEKRYRVKKGQRLTDDVKEKLKKEIKTKQIEATHLNYGTKESPRYRKFRVGDIGGSGNDKFTLVNKETKTTQQITIKDYFKKTYNISLKYPDLPCIIDNGRKIPLELCKLVEKQRVSRKMTPDETSEIIRRAALPAIRHFEEVEKNVQEVIKTSRETAREFGIELNPKLIEVDGRELGQISMKAGGNKSVWTSEGQYNVQRERFFKPAQVQSWAVAFLRGRWADQDKDRLDRGTREVFRPAYAKEAGFKGVSLGPLSDVNFIPPKDDGKNVENMQERDLRNMLGEYYNYCNTKRYDHVIFVLPDRCPEWIYGHLQYLEASIKGPANKQRWTRASCLKLENFKMKILGDQRSAQMFISNLWLKYNTKLGGTNFVLDIKPTDLVCRLFQPGYLYISVDVCHPAPGDKLIQSVAAVVGMWDLTGPNGISYCTRVRVQKKEKENKSTVEHVLEIDQMVQDVLRSYKESRKTVPTHVVLLRDGVSEGQFEIVLDNELTRLSQLFSKIYNIEKKPMPKMSCFVVQKRHKIRFRRKEPVKTRKGTDDYNIQPGTVVDNEVTHPTDHSFYIAPHRAIQGTARAAYIYMILDQIGFSQDEAQALIFSLSYLSPRCTKGTSIPTPVNLADRAAERGRNLVIAWNSINPQKMTEEDRIKKLNDFLANMGDPTYRHTLYYI